MTTAKGTSTMDFMRIEPQAARGKLKESMWTDPAYEAEIKYDGIRQTSQFLTGVVRFTGRRESVNGGLTERSAQVPHLSGVGCPASWRNPNVADLEGTVLDGEVVLNAAEEARVRAEDPRGGLSKVVQRMLNSLPDEALRKQQVRGFLEYAVFDCLWWRGQDLRQLPRRKRRKYLIGAVACWNNPYVRLAESVVDGKREFYDGILARGGEGIILKHVDSKYGQQTKWIKVKGEWTADVVITGYEEPEALSVKVGDTVATPTKLALAGLIGAVQVSQYRDGQLVVVASISGMDDQLRSDLSARRDYYLGSVVRIKHNGREPTGRFRHPRWDDFRDDKAATACVWDPNER